MSTDKQLSDAEIDAVALRVADAPMSNWGRVFARAVIEADRKLAQGEPVAEFHVVRLDANTSRHHLKWLSPEPIAHGIYPLYAAIHLAQPENHDSVRIPIGEDEAAMMVMLGTNWLKAHAPGRLAQGEPAAWVTPMLRYGSRLTFYKPPKPHNWDDNDDGPEWYCHPLYAAPQAAVPAENSEHQSAALVGEPFLPKDSPGHSV